MSADLIENGTQFISLEEALAGEGQPPPLTSEFSVLLVGILKPDASNAKSNGVPAVRLYPADGREDEYYLIKKADVDGDRVEPVSPDLVAGRGWIADKVVRVQLDVRRFDSEVGGNATLEASWSVRSCSSTAACASGSSSSASPISSSSASSTRPACTWASGCRCR